jgi:hypothetical protein
MMNGRRGEMTASQPASEMKTKPPKLRAEICSPDRASGHHR